MEESERPVCQCALVPTWLFFRLLQPDSKVCVYSKRLRRNRKFCPKSSEVGWWMLVHACRCVCMDCHSDILILTITHPNTHSVHWENFPLNPPCVCVWRGGVEGVMYLQACLLGCVCAHTHTLTLTHSLTPSS